MMTAVLAFLILAVMAAAFLTRRIPHYLTAVAGSLAMAACGILPAKDLFLGFSNPTLILFAGMFVIGESMFRTGLADAAGAWAVRRLGHGERPLLWASMGAAGLLSTVASNTGTAAALMPVIIGMCGAAGISVSRQLMPMAFATGFGGFSALIGTPPNMIVSEALSQAGLRPFGFFEFAWLGIPLALAGMAYMDFARRWLPSGPSHAPEHMPETAVAGAPPRRGKMWTAALILLAVVVVMASGWQGLPLEAVAVAGAVACVATGCLTGPQAIKGIEWETLILFGSMFAVAQGLEASGAARLVAAGMGNILGAHPAPWALVALPIVVTMLMGTVLSNTACAVIMAPIGLDLAAKTGADPRAVLMAIALAASCSFLTPVGTPPNMLVWGPGGYRFPDFVKVGAGLSAVCLITAVVIIPWRWPVFGG
jgi:solute carrier family 13 (sodium-dependent dicarboxylate transporter), member 2/3/5